jgi:hypothetical protein
LDSISIKEKIFPTGTDSFADDVIGKQIYFGSIIMEVIASQIYKVRVMNVLLN